MRKLIIRVVIGLMLSVCFSPVVHADFIPITDPNATYLTSTTRLNVVAPDFNVLSSLTNGIETVTFGIPLVALTVPTTWATWGSPPNTESATPRVLWTNGLTSLTMNLAAPVLTFGFEAEPNAIGLSSITASFFSSGTLIGTITRSIDGNAGARLFAAITSTSSFDRVVLTGVQDFAIANLRYAAPQVIPEPGSATLTLLGGVLLLLLKRCRRHVDQ